MMRDFMTGDSLDMDISEVKDIELSEEARSRLAEVFADVDSETTTKTV